MVVQSGKGPDPSNRIDVAEGRLLEFLKETVQDSLIFTLQAGTTDTSSRTDRIKETIESVENSLNSTTRRC